MRAFGVVCVFKVLFCFASLVIFFAYVDGFSCSIEMHLVCSVYCVCGFVLPVLCLWFLLYILMVSSVQCVYICCEFACRASCIILLVLLLWVYIVAFFCSIRVHVVCCVHEIRWFVLLVMLIWLIVPMLMVSSVQFVCIWCVLFMMYVVLFCSSCWFGFFCIY